MTIARPDPPGTDARLLIVEDDDRIAAPLERALAREGYRVERFSEGLPALERARRGDIDLVLLDLGLPDVDGLDVCRRLREQGYQAAIMILTARDEELDRVVGLDSGADDYLAKPFGLAELTARSRALLRRSQPSGPASASPPEAVSTTPVGLRVDRRTRQVHVDGREVALTPKEFDVLALLQGAGGAVVTREAVIAAVWDENWYGSTKMLDAALGRLRQKLEEAGSPVTVLTVRGVGFRLSERAPGA